ncbi:mechanosensitive ion channel family protein [Pseudomonas yangonensis]|uniref:mechanosensitive ion channel family protein n=1 Tax=Pseudomonas yangonensis TaxID=2579922 RepID=UPI00137A3755|nr:mechanosensitive ion channel domain-containing protein [Pseudomonas yangonensis]
MPNELNTWTEWLEQQRELLTFSATLALILAAWLSNWLVKHILVRAIYRVIGATTVGQHGRIKESGIIKRLSNVVPALVLSSGVMLVPNMPVAVVEVTRNVCSAFIVLTIALAIAALLDILNTLYQRRPSAHLKPIKGYLQVIKIAIFAIAAILIVAALIDRSPLILLSGLGAMAAVLLLIFQDTLLSLVASVQISSSDIIRVGDWVEMPNLNADGDVIDIALHTVKVQNWDKTITTIPTKRFITDPFKNWRGMQESGGRRIKRALYLDQTSVHFLSDEEIARLRRFMLLDEYLDHKDQELRDWNLKLAEHGKQVVNTRRITNIGSFRAYIEHYLRHNPNIHQNMTLMVRQLSPTADGLPLEIYCFTNTVAWSAYEGIQSDIFDHLLAILPEFGLRVFQHPSGADMRELRPALHPAPEQAQPAAGASVLPPRP